MEAGEDPQLGLGLEGQPTLKMKEDDGQGRRHARHCHDRQEVDEDDQRSPQSVGARLPHQSMPMILRLRSRSAPPAAKSSNARSVTRMM